MPGVELRNRAPHRKTPRNAQHCPVSPSAGPAKHADLKLIHVNSSTTHTPSLSMSWPQTSSMHFSDNLLLRRGSSPAWGGPAFLEERLCLVQHRFREVGCDDSLELPTLNKPAENRFIVVWARLRATDHERVQTSRLVMRKTHATQVLIEGPLASAGPHPLKYVLKVCLRDRHLSATDGNAPACTQITTTQIMYTTHHVHAQTEHASMTYKDATCNERKKPASQKCKSDAWHLLAPLS